MRQISRTFETCFMQHTYRESPQQLTGISVPVSRAKKRKGD